MLRGLVLVGVFVAFAIPAIARSAEPIVVALAATEVTESSATLHGTVDPQGEQTSYRFRYDNGSILHQFDTITRDAGAGVGPVAVQVRLGGLDPGTTYNVSVVAVRGDAEVVSDPVKFTTPGHRDSTSCHVPNLVGVPADRVNAKLLARGCELGRVQKRRGTRCVSVFSLVACDHAWVVAQKPKASSYLARFAEVAVTIGPRRPGRHTRGAAR